MDETRYSVRVADHGYWREQIKCRYAYPVHTDALHFWKRLGFAFGAGLQIGAAQFHAYEHNWVTSVHFPFWREDHAPK